MANHTWKQGYATLTVDTGTWPPTLMMEGPPYRDRNNYEVRDTVEMDLTEELTHDLQVTLEAVCRKFRDYDGVIV